MARSLTVPPQPQASRIFFAVFSMTEIGRRVAKSSMTMTVLPPRWARSRRSTTRPNFQRGSEKLGDSSGPAGRFGRFISASPKSVSGFCLPFISIRFLDFVMSELHCRKLLEPRSSDNDGNSGIQFLEGCSRRVQRLKIPSLPDSIFDFSFFLRPTAPVAASLRILSLFVRWRSHWLIRVEPLKDLRQYLFHKVMGICFLEEMSGFFFEHKKCEPLQGRHATQQVGGIVERIEVHIGFA